MISSLKNIFREKAQNSKSLQFVFNHSAQISSGSYLAANLVQLFKHGLHPDLATLSGAFFIVSSAFVWKSKFKSAGLTSIAGHVALGASYAGSAGFLPQILGVLPMAAQGVLMMLDGKTAALSESRIPAFLKRPYEFVRQYPLFSSGLLGASGAPSLMLAAFRQNPVDIGQIISVIGWGVGDAGLGLSDPAVREKIKANVPELPAARPA